jgi:hypothetical protein
MAKYEITTDGKTTTVEADSTDNNDATGNLRLWRDGAVVAEFRWWNSLVRKDDD